MPKDILWRRFAIVMWLAAVGCFVGGMAAKPHVRIAVLQAQPAPSIDLYFVAIGSVPGDMLDGFVAHFQAKLGVSSKVLTPLGFDQVTFDAGRSQMSADRLIQAVRFRYPTLVKNPRTRVIAVTPYDMYMEAMREQWRFTFSLRSSDQRMAVVSVRADGSGETRRPAGRRIASHAAAEDGHQEHRHHLFGLPLSDDPRSVLFGNVLGVENWTG